MKPPTTYTTFHNSRLHTVSENISLRFFLAEARKVIPKHWKSQVVPTLLKRVEALNDIIRMKQLLAQDYDTMESF